MQRQGRKNRTWPVVNRAVTKVEADQGRLKAWQGTRHERAWEAVTGEANQGGIWQDNAKGYGRT